MIIKLGFEHKGFLFGWHKKQLYRLKGEINGKNYGFRKLPLIKIMGNNGYRVKTDKLTIQQCIAKTTTFIEPFIMPQHEDLTLPF
jgi:hypothetical protein